MRSLHIKPLACAVAILLGLGAVPARADEDPRVKSARDMFVQAEARYEVGDYEQAAELFEESYRLSRRPQVLIRLADAYERGGELSSAAGALEKYLQFDRDPATITRLEYIYARLRPRAEVEEPAGRWATKVVLAGSGVALASAAVFVLLGHDARNDAAAACGEADGRSVCTPEGKSAIEREGRYALAADISFGAAAASFAVGAYLFWQDREQPHVGVSAGEGGAMIWVDGALPW